ncbi:MAG: glycosyltransferase [Nevskiaceae bacterium]|nr:MAG: glycosyltransferase [Nevskiaceae bacterium]TAM30736.1 MAG: glycosyltransferase [Nevskiaceae bacterium]
MSAPTALRIAWLVWGDEPGGVASAVLNNGRLLTDLGQRVSLLSLTEGPLSTAARARGWPVRGVQPDGELHARYLSHRFSPRGLLGRAAILWRLRAALREVLAAERPDLLCLPWPDLMPLAGPICRELGIGLVLEMPNTPSPYPFALNQRIYDAMSRRWRIRVLANSDYSARHLARVRLLSVVTPAVDAGRFDPTRVNAIPRTRLGIPEDALLLAQIARLDPSKGGVLLLEAVAALAAEEPRLHLLLVGGPLASDYAQALRARAQALGIADRLHWVDTVTDPERYWATADLAASTRIDAEPFGLAIVEAMLMRKPVLVHALGAPAETIDDGETGWHYQQPDAAALTAALRRALAAREQWATMGAQARETALRRYASPEQAQRYLSLLRQQVVEASAP